MTTTNDTAHQRVVAYMQETVDALPRGATLASELPGNSAAKLGALNGPCDQDDNNPEQPYNWDLSLWVLLPPDTSSERAADSLTADWKKRGYKITSLGANGVQAATEDGYQIFIKQASTGDLSATAVSPCFPKSQLRRYMSWPTTMAQS